MNRKVPYTILLVTLALLASFFLDSYLKLNLFKKANSLIRPIAIVASETGKSVSSVFTNFRNIGKLQAENNDLKSKLNQALQEIASLDEAQKENLSLKRELDFKNKSDFTLIPSQVLSFDPSNIRDTILLDAGTENGVKEGNIVLAEGFLVGKIVSVGPNSSKLMLISDPLSAIPATISTSTTTGIVKGRIGSGLILEQVPQSEKVTADDTVVTSGLGNSFPKGLIIGKVEEIQKISGSIFQSISVRSMVDLSKLERVMIIKG